MMRQSIHKKMQHWIEYFCVRWMMVFTWLAPLPAAFKFAEALGWIAFYVLRIRRSVVMQNLTRAFPEKSKNEKKMIAFRAYKNFGRFVIEYMRIPIEKKECFLARRVIQGSEVIDQGLQKGHGVVLIGGHFGNFESMGSAIPMLGYPTSFLVGRQHNAMVDHIINQYRAMSGAEIIRRGFAVRGAIKALRNNKVLIFLSDQNTKRRNGVFVDFFGTPASTPQGAAAFTLKTGAQLIFGIDIPGKRGRHRLVYMPCKTDQYQGLSPDNIRDVTQQYTSYLEAWIRKYPEYYFWMHKRWKTQPKASSIKKS